MAMSTVVLKNLELGSIQNQLDQIRMMQRSVMPDDSIEANTLRDTMKLLSQIEIELKRQSETKH